MSADAWAAELESEGSVVFPPRRVRVYARLVGFGLLTVVSALTNLQHLQNDDISGTLGVLRLTALAAFMYGTGHAVWQLITKRPVLTVDESGITRGRTLPWSAISRIDAPVGLPLARSVRVQPTDRRTRPLTITPDNVDDLDALTPWLRSVLTQHRN
ncbi:hypothetical protein [Kribbella solani]|uniref:hypothetical protein n=1 Tax=Kribbella solani TaxID=236067 RepID=UPI0029BE98B2|nr:hypothetical protein [Kribbella solani]MDX2971893.1 hypothetical protein [Kribbella solani]